MKGERIPDRDNISRFCKPKTAPNGEISDAAFMLRENEKSLSVNWLEYLNLPNRDSEIETLRKIYASKFTVGRNARLAIVNVGEMRNNVRINTNDQRNIEVLHNPDVEMDDLSHSEITNIYNDNELIAELILEVLLENHSAR